MRVGIELSQRTRFSLASITHDVVVARRSSLQSLAKQMMFSLVSNMAISPIRTRTARGSSTTSLERLLDECLAR